LDRRLGAAAADHPRQPGVAHQPRDALATDTDLVVEAQLGVHARRAVRAAAVAMDRLDQPQQLGVLARAARRRALLPGMKARARDLEHVAQQRDRVTGLLRRDEPEDHRRLSLSLAKKAAAEV
jgi:hypothetical protein